MNNIIKSTILNKIQNFMIKFYKLILVIVAIIFFIIIGIQYYFYQMNKQILQASVDYNFAQSNKSDLEFNDIMINLSKQKNFYGILASLENIDINNDIESAYNDYIKLINNEKLNSLYKTAIAINASYSLMEYLDKDATVANKITKLISYTDPSLVSYEGFKLEIKFLLYVFNNINIESIEYSELYNQIQDNEKISSSIKERVKKINEFQKYK